MTTGGSNLQGSLNTLLTFDVGEVEVELQLLVIKLLARVDDCRFVGRRAVEEVDNIHQCLHAVDLQLVDDGRFADVLLGNDEALEFLLAGTDGDGQCTADRLQVTVQS